MKKKDPTTIQPQGAQSRDLILYLIREELKSRKFFSGLQRLGLDYCFYQPLLDQPILAAFGFSNPSDEMYAAYFKLIEKRSRKICEDITTIEKQARKVYKQLANWSDMKR